MIHRPAAFLAREALLMVDMPHGNHFLSLENLAIAPGTRIIRLSSLDGPRVHIGTVQVLGLGASQPPITDPAVDLVIGPVANRG